MSLVHSLVVLSQACQDINRHIDKDRHPWIAEALEAIQLVTFVMCGVSCMWGVFLLSCWVFTVVDPVILAAIFTTALCIYIAKQVWNHAQRELAEASHHRQLSNSLLLN